MGSQKMHQVLQFPLVALRGHLKKQALMAVGELKFAMAHLGHLKKLKQNVKM